jgi:hypothetical protein
MGAQTITRRGVGNSPEEALAKIKEEDLFEYGNDYYNGSAINASLGQELNHWDEEQFYQDVYDNKMRRDKNVLHYCVVQKPIPNKNKVKTHVEHFPQKGTRKWTTMYEIRGGGLSLAYKSQTEAIKIAREYQEKYPENNYEVHIIKKLEGDTRVAKITYKPSSTEKPGIYGFVGLVAV